MNTLQRLSRAGLIGFMLLGGSACSTLHLPSPFGKSDSAASGDRSVPPSQAAVATELVKAQLAHGRANLIALRADAALAAYVPVEIQDAEQALKSADSSQYDLVSGAHQAYVAEHKVQLARARAEARQLAVKLDALRAQRDQLRAEQP
ncbi:MAG: hypothetical protein NVS9B10_10910 [Nevskia sp.]